MVGQIMSARIVKQYFGTPKELVVIQANVLVE
jgi:hypothetical protein